MEIIVPAAGLSTRFPNMRPKYSLTSYDGKLMLEKSLDPYLGKYNITIGILKDHDDKYRIKELIKYHIKDNIKIVVLENETKGPADTVNEIIKLAKIDLNKEIFIKDCDSFFNHTHHQGNYICVSNLSDQEHIYKPSAKSYIISNNQGIIQKIIEKSIISDKFCVGGYKFESAELFCEAFENIKNNNKELFVSNVIEFCLSKNKIFIENIVNNYIDVGTAKQWQEYNNKAVVFCDIDGTLIQAQLKHEYDKAPTILKNNIEVIKKMINDGSQIIFVTARPESTRGLTEKMLNNLGFNSFDLLMNLINCKRILINDFNNANPYPRAIAVNIPRDSDTLSYYL